ncbi:hypothetical protein HSBAA_53710 [Vreelandella sulfidaeris]|uniref:Response regulatory domain-containing protein n=1 Tax=Vreelandella sulfidaeris TaxID=115553 RepID=A0A455UDD6_9GAMM|nr:hypothetical protein HSBAA_53710 [Halomonas sulfidaeris]
MVDHLEQQFQALESQESVTPEYPDQDHVLIIEDDKRLAELTRDYLEANGFLVTLEADGAKGVERILTLQPDLVIFRFNVARRRWFSDLPPRQAQFCWPNHDADSTHR